MILTASKFVNARLGRPSVSSPNPSFLKPGEKITVKRKAWGDPINNNNIWVLSDENDFYTSEGFGLTDEFRSLPITPPLFESLKIFDLWQFSKGEGINIGIIDNGVNDKHDALKGRVSQLNNHSLTSPSNHGTTMACISAGFDEKKGKLGLAPMVNRIFSYQLFSGEKTADVEANDLLDALNKMEAANVQIINMSFTCDTPSFFPTNNSGKRVQEKINSLLEKNIVLVCATGNDKNHIKSTADRFPAGYENVLTVTGHNFSGNIDFESNCWEGVTLATLQEHYFDDDQFEKSNGTSAATAIITGCIACIYNKINIPKTQNLKNILLKLPLLKDFFGSFSVPKFEMTSFINLIK